MIEKFGVTGPTQPVESEDDKRAKQILKSTTRSLYETGLLWKRKCKSTQAWPWLINSA